MMLNGLNADQELFAAELGLAQARRDKLLSLVQLYTGVSGFANALVAMADAQAVRMAVM
jgi:hypothetical protein